MWNHFVHNIGFKNTYRGGEKVGFQFKWTIPYYRGIFISCMSSYINLKVDGVEYPPEKLSFKIGEKIVPWTKIDKATDVFWPYGTYCTLLVDKPGGLSEGLHKIEFAECIRKSYGDLEPLPEYAYIYGDRRAASTSDVPSETNTRGGEIRRCSKDLILVM